MGEIGRRGGARPGSGRKPAINKKVTISFRVTKETHDEIQNLRNAGVNVSDELEQLIQKLKRDRL